VDKDRSGRGPKWLQTFNIVDLYHMQPAGTLFYA